MKFFATYRRTLALLGVCIPLLVVFIYVGLRSGPLAPVAVTVVGVESKIIKPAIFGIGTVDARFIYKIGPTAAGRIKSMDVHVGNKVKAGQMLGEMDQVDLDDRIQSQQSVIKRAEAALREAEARNEYAQNQVKRYGQLFALRSTSEEIVTTKRLELKIAQASLAAAQEELARSRSDREALLAQRANLRLIAPVDGVVTMREADPGTTIVGGQTVVEIINPQSLWINVRFDQISASGLAPGLPAHIILRSRPGQVLHGQIMRVEPKADQVTEETLAKVIFKTIAEPLPALGELAEVTVDLLPLPARPSIPNAAIRRKENQMGVWRIVDNGLQFSPIKLGAVDLGGLVQVHDGLNTGDQVVVYSERALNLRSKIRVVNTIPGTFR